MRFELKCHTGDGHPDDDERFEEPFPKLVKHLEEQFVRSGKLQKAIREGLKEVADAG